MTKIVELARWWLGIVLLLPLVGCSSYTISHKYPVMIDTPKGPQLLWAEVLLHERVPIGGKKIGSESLEYIIDGDSKSITFGRETEVDNIGTALMLQAMTADSMRLLREAIAAFAATQGVKR